MAPSTVSDRYDATPEAAWTLLGDFAGIGQVFTQMTDVSVSGDERTFTLFGMRMTERLLERDEATRKISYSIIEGVDGIESHQATIAVAPDGDGCKVDWTVVVAPEAAEPLFSDSYRQALASLHRTLDPA
jgi:carbon monoxide dehydrogenase subunit G